MQYATYSYLNRSTANFNKVVHNYKFNTNSANFTKHILHIS